MLRISVMDTHLFAFSPKTWRSWWPLRAWFTLTAFCSHWHFDISRYPANL